MWIIYCSKCPDFKIETDDFRQVHKDMWWHNRTVHNDRAFSKYKKKK